MTVGMTLPEGWRAAVPEVEIPRHPLWIDAYHGAWDVFERWAERGGNPAEAETAAAIAHYARYAGAALPLHDWLDRQRETTPSPLHAWAEWSLFQVEGNVARLARALPALRTHYFQLQAAGRRGGSEDTMSGTPAGGPAEGLYYRSEGAHEIEEPEAQGASTELSAQQTMGEPPKARSASIALSAQQAMAAECLAKIARAVGAEAEAEAFEGEWRGLQALSERWCWDHSAHYYADCGVDGAPVPVKAVDGLWPLAAGTASAERAGQVAAHLSEPAEFWRVHVFPSLSADHPRYSDRGYRRRGGVEPFQNYAIIKGLERYGLHELARRAADNHLTTLSHVYKETQSHWDHYAPEYIEPAGDARHDAAGTGVSAIALLLETVLGLHPDAHACTLHWRPALHEAHRVAGLPVGGARVSLEVTPAAGRPGHLHARVRSTAPLRLHVSTPEGEQWAEVEDGSELSVAAW